MSDPPRRARRAHWFLLLGLAFAWLGLARSDHAVAPGPVVGVLPDGTMIVAVPTKAPPNLHTLVAIGPTLPPAPPPPPPRPPPPAGPATCGAAEVDPEVTFASDATHQHLTIDFRNRGAAPCRLGSDVHFGATGDDPQRQELKIANCYQCGAAPPSAMEPVVLEPGQATSLHLDWPLEAAATPGTCRDADGLWLALGAFDRSHPVPGVEVRLGERKLRLCPPVDYGPYRPAEPASPGSVRLVLGVDQPDYYPDEYVLLRLAAEDPGHALAKRLETCPDLSLLTKARRPEAGTEFHAIAVKRRDGRTDHPFYTGPNAWYPEPTPSSTMNFPNEMSYFIRTDETIEHGASYVSTCGGWETMARSADLEIRVVGGRPPRPRWGTPTDGFAVALATDRDHYPLRGPLRQDIPLHVACTRFARDWAVQGEVPLCQVGLEAVDSAGTAVPVIGLDTLALGGGHGWRGTEHVEGDAVVEEPTSLVFIGPEPPRPGTYRITATWLAHDDDDPGNKPIAVRSLPVTLTIGDPAP